MDNRINKFFRAPLRNDEIEFLLIEKELIVKEILDEASKDMTAKQTKIFRQLVMTEAFKVCESEKNRPGYFEDGIFDDRVRQITKEVKKKLRAK